MGTVQSISPLESNRCAALAAVEEFPLSTSSTAFLSLLGVLAFGGALAVLLPFAGPIVLASALTITSYPVYRWMGRHWPWLSPTVRAALVDLMVLTLCVLPVFLLFWTAASQADNVRSVVARWVQASQAIHQGRLDGSLCMVRPIPDAVARESGISRVRATAWLMRNAARGLDRMSDWAQQAFTQLLQSVVGLLLCPLIQFLLLREGPAYVERLRRFLPLNDEDQERLLERTRAATVAVVRGLFLTSLLEGAAATGGYALMGIPSAILLGVLTGFASAVPVIGTSTVWVPVGLVTILSGRVMPGFLVLAWGTGMVFLIDDVAAPWLVGHRIHMSLLPLLFGILGGAAVFGLKGLLIGPLIVSISPTVFELVRRRVFGEEIDRVLDPQTEPSRHDADPLAIPATVSANRRVLDFGRKESGHE